MTRDYIMVRSFIAPALALLLTYLLFAFVQWEWNPAAWSEQTRVAAACLGAWFAFAAYGASKESA